MCIVFIWRREAGIELKSKLKFILAANRDEVFWRPAQEAQFWNDHPHVLGGRDLTEGLSGGTWAGITKQGKVGFLTNIRTDQMSADPNKKGRGSLVSNFLINQQQSVKNYCTELDSEKLLYRKFNMVCGDVNENEFYYINSVDESPPVLLKPGSVCVSNGTLNCKWFKVEKSLEKFQKLVDEYTNKDTDSDGLLETLLTFLEDKDRNYPDPNITVNNPVNEHLSSIFIPYMPEFQYGTRTNTIITVDEDNHVTFLERTKENKDDPVSKWRRSLFQFDLETLSKI